MAKNKVEVVWEDEDTGFDDLTESKGSSEEFSALLERDKEDDEFYQKGSRLTGKVSSIPTSGDVVVELDRRTSALMELGLFRENYPELGVGDEISAFFVSYQDGAIILAPSLSAAATSAEALSDAFASKTPVKGKVTGSNKGGFEVTVVGKKAFCPISQIDTKFVENQEEYLGKEFEFLITKLEGRDLVVSRRDFLRLKEKEALAKLEESWRDNPVVTGTVTEVKDFGLVIEVAGARGFCHISEIAHSRVNHPGEAYKKGERVNAVVTDLDMTSTPPKLSLSIKQAEKDPWDDVATSLNEGDTRTGSVTRLADFGAFVELAPGLEGLIHISEMSWEKRIHHPKDILAVGDSVEVRVLSVDLIKQRISLTMKHYSKDPWKDTGSDLKPGTKLEGTVTSLKGFGAFVELAPGIDGFVPLKVLQKAYGPQYRKKASPPQKIQVEVFDLDLENRKILLSIEGVDPNKDEAEDHKKDFEAYRASVQKSKEEKNSTKNQGSFGDLLKSALTTKDT